MGTYLVLKNVCEADKNSPSILCVLSMHIQENAVSYIKTSATQQLGYSDIQVNLQSQNNATLNKDMLCWY